MNRAEREMKAGLGLFPNGGPRSNTGMVKSVCLSEKTAGLRGGLRHPGKFQEETAAKVWGCSHFRMAGRQNIFL